MNPKDSDRLNLATDRCAVEIFHVVKNRFDFLDIIIKLT